MKQVHKLKQLNKKLEGALLEVKKIAFLQGNKQIQQIVDDALDRKGNHK